MWSFEARTDLRRPGKTGLWDGDEMRGRLEDSDSDPVMNDIIGFTPCNFCDYMCMNFKFVAHLPPWYNLLQNDASLADTFFMIDGALTFEGCDSSVLSGAGRRVRLRRSLARRATASERGLEARQ